MHDEQTTHKKSVASLAGAVGETHVVGAQFYGEIRYQTPVFPNWYAGRGLQLKILAGLEKIVEKFVVRATA